MAQLTGAARSGGARCGVVVKKKTRGASSKPAAVKSRKVAGAGSSARIAAKRATPQRPRAAIPGAKKRMPQLGHLASARPRYSLRATVSVPTAVEGSQSDGVGTLQKWYHSCILGSALEGDALWESAKAELQAMPGKRRGSLLILDWDDTIFPTSALDAGHHLDGSVPKVSLSLELNECAAAAVLALRSARAAGSTVIVTNARHGWVQATAASFMPLLASELKGIPVISSRSIFEPQAIHNPKHWKVLCFQRIAQLFRIDTAGLKSIVSIGDSLDEQEASILVAKRCECFSKTLKLVERPTVPQVTKQLEVFSDQLSLITAHRGNLDIDLSQIIADEGELAVCILETQARTARSPGQKDDTELVEKQPHLRATKLGA